MNIEAMRKALFAKDETNAYVERESAIDAFLKGDVPPEQGERYITAMEFVLRRMSTPIEEGDVLLGRMVEGPVPYEMVEDAGAGFNHIGNPFGIIKRIPGHMSLDYDDLVRKGLSGIVEDMERNARSKVQKLYAGFARRASQAIRAFAERYAFAAEEACMERAARALRVVPYGPAYDFFSAMQSIWLMEMILSCVVGGRDFAYSRLDLTVLPYFRAGEKEDALEILESFFLKNNEIGGLNSDLYKQMPVPCASTNIYLMLGGTGAEHALPLSLLFLQAAANVHLPQPVLALRISKDNSPPDWKNACAQAAQELDGQVSFYNDDVIIHSLESLGLTRQRAIGYTMSGCNRAEFQGHQSSDYIHNCPAMLLDAFYDPEAKDMEGILASFKRGMMRELKASMGVPRFDPEEELHFCLESLLLRGCVEQVCDIENGGQYQETVVHQMAGIATVADSLCAISKAVFEDKILTLDAFRALVREDFAGDPELHQRIRNTYPKYGNDDERADCWAALASECFVDIVRGLNENHDRIHIPGIYSMFCHIGIGRELGATPDGRLTGEPVSENQSPVYGKDREGLTALLHSVSRLPQRLTGCGGLNVRLDKKLDNAVLAGLTDTYFGMGGVNLTINVVSRETLLAAMENPSQYQSLFVRIVGYSEVFVRLPDYLQQELISRTTASV